MQNAAQTLDSERTYERDERLRDAAGVEYIAATTSFNAGET